MLVNCVPVAGDSEEFGCVPPRNRTDTGRGGQTAQAYAFGRLYGQVRLFHILYRDSCMEAVISQAVKFSYSDSNTDSWGDGDGKGAVCPETHNSAAEGNFRGD